MGKPIVAPGRLHGIGVGFGIGDRHIGRPLLRIHPFALIGFITAVIIGAIATTRHIGSRIPAAIAAIDQRIDLIGMPGAMFGHDWLAGVGVEGNALNVAVAIGIDAWIEPFGWLVTFGSIAVTINT